jgi:hypothetical protein
MKRRETSRIQFDALQIEGALIQPDVVAKIAAGRAWGQTDESYGVLPGLKLRDEIGRYYQVGRTLWQRFETGRAGENANLAHVQFARDFLTKVLGFELEDAAVRSTTSGYQLVFAKNRGVPIAIAGAQGLDKAETVATTGGNAIRRSATTAVQGELNGSALALWGIALDGARLRLLRDNASLTRPALIECDLDRIFRTDLYADFTLLWLLVHESRFGDGEAPSTECALETWRHQGREQGVAARGRLRDGVEMALYEFGSGFVEHPDNRELRARLTDGNGAALAKEDYFRQLLRLVYRLILVMTAEDREILFAPDASDEGRIIYRDGYALARLRERSRLKSAWDRHHDVYEGLKATFRALASGDARLGLPALGGLFDSDQIADLAAAKISNKRFLTGLFHLGWLRNDTGLVRINWRDMETEEFGSVYESLLELTPALVDGASGFYFINGVGDERSADTNSVSGNQRKTTSSYYTKDSLVDFLLNSALDPIIDRTIAENPSNPDALLRLSIVDPACGSGHFILGAARRIARRLADLRNPGASSIKDFRHALREVVSHCVYGVDQNELAVELCRVALWIEAVEPGKPLSFLDAKIRHGNSLIGVADLAMLAKGIPDAAYAAMDEDNKAVASHYRTLNRSQRDGKSKNKGQSTFEFAGAPKEITDAARALEQMSENDVGEVRAKAAAFEALHATDGWVHLKTACDLFVAAFFMSKVGEVPRTPADEAIPTTDHVWLSLRGSGVRGQVISSAIAASTGVNAFHWPLMFPEVFGRGGFDAVIGNPPWDTMSPDVKEFFAPYDPQIRSLAPAEQKARVEELKSLAGVREEWAAYVRSLYSNARFIKESGRFTLFAEGNLGKGDFNVYRMFVELALKAVRPGGRAAQFVPENLYNGANAAAIRRHLFEQTSLIALVAFENSRQIWFDIHGATKFCMYIAVPGAATVSFGAAFGVNTIKKLESLSEGLPFNIPVAVVREFSPDALAIAEIAHKADIEIARKIYSALPKFAEYRQADGSRPYLAELHMGNERELYSVDGTVPVMEGRMVEAFDYRAKAYSTGRGRSAQWRSLMFGGDDKKITPQWLIDVDGVANKIGDRWLKYRIAFCNVGGVTNQRYLMASFVPPRTICGDSVPTILFDPEDLGLMALWLGVANSLAIDYLARKKGALHLTFTVMDSLPLPVSYDASSHLHRSIAVRALRLGAVGSEMDDLWTAAVRLLDIDPQTDGRIEEAEARTAVRSEIDVLVARDLFGLTKDEFRYLIDPADVVENAEFETFGALKRAEQRLYAVFRTKDLILQAWDKLAFAGAAHGVQLGRLPVPASIGGHVDPNALPDGAWIGPQDAAAAHVATAQLAALLKALPGPAAIAKIRLAALCALEPRYLVPHLSQEGGRLWRRLVGPAAAPFSGASVRAFAPKMNAGWRAATTQLRGMKCIVEDPELLTWAPGINLDKFRTESWPDGRARFVLDALRNVSLATAIAELPSEDQGWVNARAA